MKILLVEDDEVDAKLVKRFLPGVEVVMVRYLSEAKELASEQTFDAALVDLCLPDGDGEEIIDDLSSLLIPVVVYSGLTGRELENRVLSLGAKRFIPKDSRPDFIRAVLEEVVWTPGDDHGKITQAERNLVARYTQSIVFTSGPDGGDRCVSPGYTLCTGRTPEEVRGHGWTEYLRPDDTSTHPWWQSLCRGEDVPKSRIFEFMHGSLGWRWIKVAGRRIPELGITVGFAWDVTARHEIEGQL